VYQARTLRRGDERLAHALTKDARTLTAATMSRVAPQARTVGAEIVVMRFVERFAAAVERADWTVLLEWVDGSCQRYAGILPAAPLLCTAVDTVTRTIGDDGAALVAAELDVVRAEVERLVSLPRLVRDPSPHEAIDEVDVALDDLLTRLDQSDALTAEHSRAVSAWCARLAKRLALSKNDAIHVTRCGLVHDIGKIVTPPEILNAPRSLNDEEMTIMRAHAEEGAKIVAATPLAINLVPAVRNHHERFDGRGYPDGLAATAIPSAARIVSVADAFNAMIGRRPYRPPLPPAVALEQLNAGRGTQFDPIVVDAMVDVVTHRT
jgi:putative nucleotidyltransferase with HDIG domain